jgi:hypothetical protein
VDLYRALAAQRPEAFRPDLARSLCVLARRANELDNPQHAMLHAHEAISTLSQEFLCRPNAHAPLLRVMLREYLSLCETTQQSPDLTLLEPLLPYFANEE